MDMRDLIRVVEAANAPQPLYEMASLPPHQTGLPFAVWVSPRGGAKHDARIKVTTPPYGSHPEAVYQIRPFGFVEGQRWLSSQQEQELEAWVALNEAPLVDFWRAA